MSIEHRDFSTIISVVNDYIDRLQGSHLTEDQKRFIEGKIKDLFLYKPDSYLDKIRKDLLFFRINQFSNVQDNFFWSYF